MTNRNSGSHADITATMKFRGVELIFRRNITFHDHLWRVFKAFRILLKAECAQFNPVLTDWGSVFYYYEEIAKTSPLFQELGAVTLNAMVDMGYDRERMGHSIQKWLKDCAEDALKELIGDAETMERGKVWFT